MALLCIAVLATVALTASTASATPAGSVPPAIIVVQPGDTLWSIALRTRPEVDPRHTVYELVQLNRLSDSGLEPGQELRLPLF